MQGFEPGLHTHTDQWWTACRQNIWCAGYKPHHRRQYQKIEIERSVIQPVWFRSALAWCGSISLLINLSLLKFQPLYIRHLHNTLDANITGSTRIGRFGINAFINQYNTDGYSIRPYSVERSKLPISRTTPQLELNYPVTNNTTLGISVRYNYEHIKNELAVSTMELLHIPMAEIK